jgi:hypothetical protein
MCKYSQIFTKVNYIINRDYKTKWKVKCLHTIIVMIPCKYRAIIILFKAVNVKLQLVNLIMLMHELHMCIAFMTWMEFGLTIIFNKEKTDITDNFLFLTKTPCLHYIIHLIAVTFSTFSIFEPFRSLCHNN